MDALQGLLDSENTPIANGFLKQYVRDHLCLRAEPATNDVTDYGLKKCRGKPAATARKALGHM